MGDQHSEFATVDDFRRVFDAAQDHMVILDSELRIADANASFLAAYGTDRTAVRAWRCYQLTHRRTSPCTGPGEACPVAHAFRTGESSHELHEHKLSDGSVQYVDVLASPLTDESGAVTHVLEAMRDITPIVRRLRRADDDLRHSEALHRDLFDSAQTGMFRTRGDDGQFVAVNEQLAAMLGTTPAELIGQSAVAIWADSEARGRLLETLRAEGQVVDAEVEVKTRAGERRHWLVSMKVLAETGELQGSARDVTDQRALEHQLRQSQKMEAVGRLAGGVAHDFNNLLTVISSFCSFARDSLSPSDPARADIVEALGAAERAARLTRQLLAFSRNHVEAPEVMSLNEIVLGADAMLRRVLGEDVEFVTIACDNLWHARIDPSQLDQVLVNLAVNARDAMDSGGTLTIETANEVVSDAQGRRQGLAPGDYVLMSVRDDGCGMSDEVLAHVFEPFFTTKEVGKGTGLGLATCYGIVQSAGGHIAVASEPGRGTTFEVYLPRAAAAPTPWRHRDSTGVPAGGGETVLVVEDEPGVRRLACRTLRAYGYEVIEAENGGIALLCCEQHEGDIDLLLTDVVMPQLGGPDLAARLAPLRPAMKVLFMSGYIDKPLAPDGAFAGGGAFLAKPFLPKDLARKVRTLLDGDPVG